MVLISSKLELITVSNPLLSAGQQSKGGVPVLCVVHCIEESHESTGKKISSEGSEPGFM